MRRLALLDIGARDGLQWPWRDLSDLIDPTLVEPDQEEARNLSGRVLPVALWERKERLSIYVTQSHGASSVFKPNRAFLDQFPESERFDIKSSFEVEATTIDDLGLACDFIKVDTQGSELAILRGGQNALRHAIGVEVEVEFVQMYEHQPLFADVDQYMRSQGFELWDIRRTYWKYKHGVSSSPNKGRLIFGDALYLRQFSPLLSEHQTAMLTLAAIAYGFHDYAASIVENNFDGRDTLREMIRSGMRPLRNGSWPIFVALDSLAQLFRPMHNRWVMGGETLGSRKRLSLWR